MDGDFTRRQTTIGGLTILAVLTLTALVPPWLDARVPTLERWRDGVPYEVGAEIMIIPQPGSSLNVGYSRPGRMSAQAKFTVDGSGLEYTIKIAPFDGSLDSATALSNRRLKRVHGVVLAEPQGKALTRTGIPWRQGTFTAGAGRYAGRYAVYLPTDHSVTVEVVAAGNVDAVLAASGAINDTFASVTSGRQR